MSVPGMPSRTADEAGLSLPEVIISTAVSALVLTMLGSMFVTGFKTQAAVSGRDAATGAAQVVSNSVQTAVRNASTVSVVSGKLLRARVTTATGWQCVAWALTTDNKLVYKTASAAITSTDYATWTVLAVGASGSFTGGAAFAPVGSSTQVNYSLAFVAGDITVPVAGAATANAYGAGSPATCG